MKAAAQGGAVTYSSSSFAGGAGAPAGKRLPERLLGFLGFITLPIRLTTI